MLYITKEELGMCYRSNNEGKDLTDIALDNAVDDYNGRLDNFADALLEEILEGANSGDYDEEVVRCCDHDYESGCPCCGNECDKCYKEEVK
jgi:hypothetical protein